MDVHKLYQTLTGEPYPEDRSWAGPEKDLADDEPRSGQRTPLLPAVWSRLRRAIGQPGEAAGPN